MVTYDRLSPVFASFDLLGGHNNEQEDEQGEEYGPDDESEDQKTVYEPRTLT